MSTCKHGGKHRGEPHLSRATQARAVNGKTAGVSETAGVGLEEGEGRGRGEERIGEAYSYRHTSCEDDFSKLACVKGWSGAYPANE